jgi:hypothetical protein
MTVLPKTISEYPEPMLAHAFALQDALQEVGVEVNMLTALQVAYAARRVATLSIRSRRINSRLMKDPLTSVQRRALVKELADVTHESKATLRALAQSR